MRPWAASALPCDVLGVHDAMQAACIAITACARVAERLHTSRREHYVIASAATLLFDAGGHLLAAAQRFLQGGAVAADQATTQLRAAGFLLCHVLRPQPEAAAAFAARCVPQHLLQLCCATSADAPTCRLAPVPPRTPCLNHRTASAWATIPIGAHRCFPHVCAALASRRRCCPGCRRLLMCLQSTQVGRSRGAASCVQRRWRACRCCCRAARSPPAALHVNLSRGTPLP